MNRLKNKHVLDYEEVLQESIVAGVSLLRWLYDTYIPIKAKARANGTNVSIYELYNGEKIVVRWNN